MTEVLKPDAETEGSSYPLGVRISACVDAAVVEVDTNTAAVRARRLVHNEGCCCGSSSSWARGRPRRCPTLPRVPSLLAEAAWTRKETCAARSADIRTQRHASQRGCVRRSGKHQADDDKSQQTRVCVLLLFVTLHSPTSPRPAHARSPSPSPWGSKATGTAVAMRKPSRCVRTSPFSRRRPSGGGRAHDKSSTRNASVLLFRQSPQGTA